MLSGLSGSGKQTCMFKAVIAMMAIIIIASVVMNYCDDCCFMTVMTATMITQALMMIAP